MTLNYNAKSTPFVLMSMCLWTWGTEGQKIKQHS